MIRRPRVLLDVDGVLADFAGAACAVLSATTGQDLLPTQIDQWDIMEALRIPRDVRDAAWQRFASAGFCASIKPYPGAQAMVAELQTWSDLYAVTSPLEGPHWSYEREQWLQRLFDIPKERVASVRDKSIVEGDALVDDKLSTVVEWRRYHPSSIAVFWRNPHNRHEKHHGVEAETYAELLAHLQPLRRLSHDGAGPRDQGRSMPSKSGTGHP